MELDGREAMELGELLDMTPVKARGIIALRNEYRKTLQTTVTLNPNVNPDARIIDAMGWGPGGIGAIKK